MKSTYQHLVFLYQGLSGPRLLDIPYCPTEDMQVDFFMKPLQGKQFCKFRAGAQNCIEELLKKLWDMPTMQTFNDAIRTGVCWT